MPCALKHVCVAPAEGDELFSIQSENGALMIVRGLSGSSKKDLCFVVYRCNNVLYIRGVEEEEEDGEMRE